MFSSLIPELATAPAPQWLPVLDSMPLFPGKLTLILLALLSVVSWAILFGKSFSLRQSDIADTAFVTELRQTTSCLNFYRSGSRPDRSPLFRVYQAGAKASAIEIVGTGEPRHLAEEGLLVRHSLSDRQFEEIEKGFDRGMASAMHSMTKGLKQLRWIAILVPVLGLLCAIGLSIRALNSALEFEALLNQTLIIISSSLAVAVPAGIGRSLLMKRCQLRSLHLQKFREQLSRSFRREFIAPEQGRKPKQSSSGPKYRSLRPGARPVQP